MTATNLVTSGNLLWKILEKYGHDPAPIFIEEGLNKEMLVEEGKLIPFNKMDRLLIKATALIEDPCFGLEAAGLWHPSFFGALGYAWLASATLRQALERLARYIHIISEKTDIRIDEREDGLYLILSDSMQSPAHMDATMAVIVSACRINCSEDFHPLSVNIIHEKPHCSGKYFHLFKAPVHFETENDSIVFSYDDIDVKLPSRNHHLAMLSDQIMIEYMAKLDRENIVHRIKLVILDHIHDGKITADKIAKEVFMSVRSLHRNLNSIGITFGSILDETRRELAEHYVRNPKEDLTEIAFRLGFSEQSSFSRAFKRWTGMSPSAYRSGLQNNK